MHQKYALDHRNKIKYHTLGFTEEWFWRASKVAVLSVGGVFLNLWLKCLDWVCTLPHDHKIISPKCCTNTGSLSSAERSLDCWHLSTASKSPLAWNSIIFCWWVLHLAELHGGNISLILSSNWVSSCSFTMSHQFSNSGPSSTALRSGVSFGADSVQGTSNSDLNSEGEAVRGPRGSLRHLKILVRDMTAKHQCGLQREKI